MMFALHWRDMQVSSVLEYRDGGKAAVVVVLSLDGPRVKTVPIRSLFITPYTALSN